MKDMVDVQGWVATAGCDALSDNVATRDATVVRCLRGAGMVLVDKTQTVQFAMGVARSYHHHATPDTRAPRAGGPNASVPSVGALPTVCPRFLAGQLTRAPRCPPRGGGQSGSASVVGYQYQGPGGRQRASSTIYHARARGRLLARIAVDAVFSSA